MRQDKHTLKALRAHDPLTTGLIVAALCMTAAFFLLPLYVMIVNSLKPLDELHRSAILSLPKDWTFQPWLHAWSSAKVGAGETGLQPFFANSLLIAAPTVLLTTLFGALNGYVLSRWRFYGGEVVYFLMLLSCFIPVQALLIPMAHALGILGLSNSIWGLILIHSLHGLAFSTLFFRRFYQAVPRQLSQVAQLDGAGFFTIFRRIYLPLSGPIIIISLVWQFTMVWNNFIFGASFASGASMPITAALHTLVASSTSVKAYNVHFAAALIAALPVLIVYTLSGRLFLRGLVYSAVKG